MTSAESLRSVRDHLSEVVDRVEHQHERVIITRNGRDAAVVISPADLAELEETIAVLGDPADLIRSSAPPAAFLGCPRRVQFTGVEQPVGEPFSSGWAGPTFPIPTGQSAVGTKAPSLRGAARVTVTIGQGFGSSGRSTRGELR